MNMRKRTAWSVVEPRKQLLYTVQTSRQQQQQKCLLNHAGAAAAILALLGGSILDLSAWHLVYCVVEQVHVSGLFDVVKRHKVLVRLVVKFAVAAPAR